MVADQFVSVCPTIRLSVGRLGGLVYQALDRLPGLFDLTTRLAVILLHEQRDQAFKRVA